MADTPLVTCSSCKGTGKRKLTRKLSWCLELLKEHEPCTPSELFVQSNTVYHPSYFNHLLSRLEQAGLVRRKDNQFMTMKKKGQK